MKANQGILETQHQALGINFKILEEVESTNDEAFKALEESPFCAIYAKKQNAGRGRLGRKWEGQEGDCIFYSAGFKVPENFNIETLTCAIALEILNIIDSENSNNLSIKWPNDIYYDGRKLCGILTESKAKNGKIESIVIGIGLNINMPNDYIGFKRRPSCLREFSTMSIEDMILNLSKAVRNTFDKLCVKYENFAKHFAKRDFLKDKEISIDKNSDMLIGLGLGVDNSAKLKFLDLNENKIYLLNAGEVSIL